MSTKQSSGKSRLAAFPAKHKTPTLASARKLPTKPRAKAAVDAAAPATRSKAQVGDSKRAQLIAWLRIPPGATISQMMTLTGWQAHTVRGTISGVLRKRMELNVISTKKDGAGDRLYCITKSRASK